MAARRAVELVTVLDELKALTARPGDGRALVLLWRRHARRLSGVAEAVRYGREADRWEAMIRAARTFHKTLVENPAEAEIVRAWEAVREAGIHPALAPREPRVRLARRRAQAIERLGRIPTTPTPTSDRALRDLWNANRALLEPCPEVAPLKARLALACGRLERHAALLRAISEADRGNGTETAVLEAANGLPSGYTDTLRARIEAARNWRPPPTVPEHARPENRVESLLDVIRSGDFRTFLARVDLALLRDHPEAFQPYRRVIEGWMRAHVLASRPVQPTLEPIATNGATATIRCTWNHAHLVHACRLSWDTDGNPDGPGPDPASGRLDTLGRFRRDGGFVVPVPAGSRDLRVAIWPVVDLGWTELRGAPCVWGHSRSVPETRGSRPRPGDCGPGGPLSILLSGMPTR